MGVQVPAEPMTESRTVNLPSSSYSSHNTFIIQDSNTIVITLAAQASR